MFDLFLLVPNSDLFRLFLFAVFIVASAFLTIGFHTRISSILVYFLVLSMHRHCPLNLDAGDLFLRLTSFILCFSHCGDAFSVDSLIANAKKDWRQVGFQTPPSMPWAQRLLQVQMAIAYFHSFWSKAHGEAWRSGDAIYWSTRFADLIRFPCPIVTDNPLVGHFMTYYTLFIEFALFTLVWFKPFRYWILLGGLILHCGIDWCMTLPGFETLFMSAYVVFVEPEDLAKAIAWIQKASRRFLGDQVTLAFDGACICCVRFVGTVHRLDVFNQMKLSDFEQAGIAGQGAQAGLVLKSKGGDLTGGALVAWMARKLPMFWLLYPLVFVSAKSRWCKKFLAALFHPCGHIFSLSGSCQNGECGCKLAAGVT
jgi:hypothetical protein